MAATRRRSTPRLDEADYLGSTDYAMAEEAISTLSSFLPLRGGATIKGLGIEWRVL